MGTGSTTNMPVSIINVCVCGSACTYACMYVCIILYMCMYIWAIRMYACMYVCVYLCAHVYIGLKSTCNMTTFCVRLTLWWSGISWAEEAFCYLLLDDFHQSTSAPDTYLAYMDVCECVCMQVCMYVYIATVHWVSWNNIGRHACIKALKVYYPLGASITVQCLNMSAYNVR